MKVLNWIKNYFEENAKRKREAKYLEWYRNPRLDD